MDVNYFGSMHVAKYAAINMSKNDLINQKGERGVIIFISSILAEDGSKGYIGYSASKAAINGVVLPMARDLGRHNIRVVSIAPGIIDTNMV